MSLSIAAYRQAGDTIEDIDVDANANIQIQKLGTRTLGKPIIPAGAMQASGLGVINSFNGVFGGKVLPNANSGTLFSAFALPDEWVSGNIQLVIFWTTASATGNDIKLTCSVKSTTKDGTVTAEETLTVTRTNAGAALVQVATVTFAAADFTAGDIVGILISRDPADAADTLGADIIILSASMRITGRG